MDVMNARQQRFVTEYLVDLNATQAAIPRSLSVITSKAQPKTTTDLKPTHVYRDRPSAGRRQRHRAAG